MPPPPPPSLEALNNDDLKNAHTDLLCNISE